MPLFSRDAPTTPAAYTLSLHDALPIWDAALPDGVAAGDPHPGDAPLVRQARTRGASPRSEEHTSELQSQFHLVCRLLREKENALFPHFAVCCNKTLHRLSAQRDPDPRP